MIPSNKRFTYLFGALLVIVLWGFIVSAVVPAELRYIGICISAFVFSIIIYYCEYLVFSTTNIYSDYVMRYITVTDFFDCYKLSANISDSYIRLYQPSEVTNNSDIMDELKEISKRKWLKFKRDIDRGKCFQCCFLFKSDTRRYDNLKAKLKDDISPLEEFKGLDDETIDNLLHINQMREFAAFAQIVRFLFP